MIAFLASTSPLTRPPIMTWSGCTVPYRDLDPHVGSNGQLTDHNGPALFENAALDFWIPNVMLPPLFRKRSKLIRTSTLLRYQFKNSIKIEFPISTSPRLCNDMSSPRELQEIMHILPPQKIFPPLDVHGHIVFPSCCYSAHSSETDSRNPPLVSWG